MSAPFGANNKLNQKKSDKKARSVKKGFLFLKGNIALVVML